MFEVGYLSNQTFELMFKRRPSSPSGFEIQRASGRTDRTSPPHRVTAPRRRLNRWRRLGPFRNHTETARRRKVSTCFHVLPSKTSQNVLQIDEKLKNQNAYLNFGRTRPTPPPSTFRSVNRCLNNSFNLVSAARVDGNMFFFFSFSYNKLNIICVYEALNRSGSNPVNTYLAIFCKNL